MEMKTIEEIEARLAEIPEEVEAAETEERVAELTKETDELETRKAEILAEKEKAEAEAEEARKAAEIEARKAEMQEVIEHPAVIKEFRKENTMTNVEMRNSEEYRKAFLKGIKTGDMAECRSLISTNATDGVVPVPTFLENEIKNAWNDAKIMSLVKQTSYKGNVKVGFEVSATGAAVHVEGNYNPASTSNPGGVPAEETLVWGSVELKAENIKKWITISDEALEGTTIDTINEVYKEIAQRIAEKAEEIAIGKIVAAGATTTTTGAGVPVIETTAIAENTIVQAEALLSGKAKNLHIAMNRQTYPTFIAVAMAANYAIDVFDGLKDKIVFTDALPAFSAASSGDTFAIIGDFGYGFQANKPNGDDVRLVVDRTSLAEKDLVKIVGKQYVGMDVVAPKAFVKINKTVATD